MNRSDTAGLESESGADRAPDSPTGDAVSAAAAMGDAADFWAELEANVPDWVDPSTSPDDVDVDEIDIASPVAWMHGVPDHLFTALRARKPIAFFEEFELPFMPRGPGFWAITKHEHVQYVSRHPELFCSGRGTNVPDLPAELNELMGSIINMDAPRHTRLRKLVSRSFTPKMVRRTEDHVREAAHAIVADVATRDSGSCDFVADIAAKLPLQIICEMMGIPRQDWDRVFELTNIILGAGDPDLAPTFEMVMGAVLELASIGQALGEARLAEPTDDLTSALMHATVEGERLTPMELASFFILLAAAGNETTRTALSHAMVVLDRNPDQRERLTSDFEGAIHPGIEEMVRWASPVIHFRRTTTCDTELGGIAMPEGTKVVMYYASANRDEAVFDRPFDFDLRRTPNDHVGFGGGGPHFCLGANLARREMEIMWDELLRWMPDLHVTGEPKMLRSAFIHGIKELPCEFTPTDVAPA